MNKNIRKVFHRYKMQSYLNNMYMSLFWAFMSMFFMLIYTPNLLFIICEVIASGWSVYWLMKMVEEKYCYKEK